MMPKVNKIADGASAARNNIIYIRDMLGELRKVAEREGADLLCYLIEMAYVEAGDLQAGTQSFSIQHRKRN
ncbi:hypothetical protein [Rhizobium tubonense]|uniref:Uncharacterized protein n=1 Tax=Rhizobium tubonense TaxID=484088 RepID=A0A2W4F4S0_9HYPH|nr:hypothetical protein [Rhizobium tubonense]PZM16813.1 hypothetical protein CPY51_00740 [Rhizobium tubonense]